MTCPNFDDNLDVPMLMTNGYWREPGGSRTMTLVVTILPFKLLDNHALPLRRSVTSLQDATHSDLHPSDPESDTHRS